MVVSETSSTITSTKQEAELRPTVKEEMLDLNMPAPIKDDNGNQFRNNIHLSILNSSIVNSHRPIDIYLVNKVSSSYIQSWWIA